MVRNDIGGKKKEKISEKTEVRKIEYYGDETTTKEKAEAETEGSPDE